MDEEWESIVAHSPLSELLERQPLSEHVSSDVLSLVPPDWLPDSFSQSCAQCCLPFKAFIRPRHHCRLCGLIYCGSCSPSKLLLPPRFLEKEPQRVCVLCYAVLAPVQDLLASSVSQASKVPIFDSHDSVSLRSYFNLPFHSTLEADLFKSSNIIRTLTRGSLAGPSLASSSLMSIPSSDSRLLLSGLSNSQPVYALVILTCLRVGAGWSGSIGTGIVVRRQSIVEGGGWSAPCAVTLVGVGWGLQFGGEVTDLVLALRSQDQLMTLINSEGKEASNPINSFGSLGGSMGLSLGPLGRRADASLIPRGKAKPFISYSKSKGIFFGCSLEGSCLRVRSQVNTKFYGRKVGANELLHPNSPGVPPPPAASHLYDSLHALTQKMDMAAPCYTTGEIGLKMASLVSSQQAEVSAACGGINELSIDNESESFTPAEAKEGEMLESQDEGQYPASAEDPLQQQEEQEVGEEEEVWGFTSAWGCTPGPRLISSSLPSLPWPVWKRDEEEEDVGAEGPAAVFPLSSPLVGSALRIPPPSTYSYLTSQDEPCLTSKAKADIDYDDEYDGNQWNLFD